MTPPPRQPFDAEGLNSAVWPPRQHVTPTDDFFRRNHAAIPEIDADAWRLEVGGLVERPRTFTLGELIGRFPVRAVTATLVCAGLRRAELLALGPLPGELPWGSEPVSTGEWSGVALRDLLDDVGISAGAGHVEFIGLDCVERHGQRFGFGGSIDLAKASSPEVLLATRLNGQPLPPWHGFPLRTVVPGWIGARSVKWLGRIILADRPSANYFQSKAYRVQREVNPSDPRDVSAGIALSAVPVNAVIVDPAPDQAVRTGPVTVRGWAMGEAGRPITALELSADGGRHWHRVAVAEKQVPWSWMLWEVVVPLERGSHELVVRATDADGTTQPVGLEEIWNVKGYNNNAWHRVKVRAD